MQVCELLHLHKKPSESQLCTATQSVLLICILKCSIVLVQNLGYFAITLVEGKVVNLEVLGTETTSFKQGVLQDSHGSSANTVTINTQYIKKHYINIMTKIQYIHYHVSWQKTL